MGIEQFTRKNRNDLLADVVDELLGARTETEFYFLISQRLRGGNGKRYKNFDKNLPPEEDYSELEVNGSQDSRRIVYDTRNFNIFATRNHYRSMVYAGKPVFTQN